MKKIFICFVIFLAILHSSSVFAIDESQDTIYYDASENKIFGQSTTNSIYSLDGYWQSEDSSSANIDIITRDDIQRQNTPSFTELLNQLGSVTTNTNNGSEGSVSSIRIRGTDRVKFLVDGIRADRPSLTTPGMEAQFLLLDDIELVEVIKGPQGNVQGANASGGVIALQTRRGYGPMKLEFGSDMGNYGTFKERFAIMGGNKKADYYLSTTWFKTDGGLKTDELGRVENDDYNNLSTVANLGVRLLDNKAELRNIFRFSRARKDIGVGYRNSYPYGTYNDPNNYVLNTDIMNNLSFKHTPFAWYDYDFKFGLYHNENDNYILADEIEKWAYDKSYLSSTRLNFMTQHNFHYKDWNSFSIGYNLENEHMDGKNYAFDGYSYNNNFYDGSTLQNDVYIHDVINIKDKLFIRGGARLTHNNQFGTYITPNASTALVLPTFRIKGAKTKFKGSWGQSVNTPTLYQRYGTMLSSYMTWSGNPNLEAEKMTSWDVGIEQSFIEDKVKFEFGYFNSWYRDYIGSYGYTDPLTWHYFGKYINVDRAKIQGYEAKASWEPNEKFKAVLNYTYTDSEDRITGLDLPATPRNRINGTIYWTPLERFTMYAGLESASSRRLSTAERVSGYVDAKLGTSIRLFSFKGAHVYLKANMMNLFNQNICMYKSGNNHYYAPKLRFTAGLFVKYNLPEKSKEKV